MTTKNASSQEQPKVSKKELAAQKRQAETDRKTALKNATAVWDTHLSSATKTYLELAMWADKYARAKCVLDATTERIKFIGFVNEMEEFLQEARDSAETRLELARRVRWYAAFVACGQSENAYHQSTKVFRAIEKLVSWSETDLGFTVDDSEESAVQSGVTKVSLATEILTATGKNRLSGAQAEERISALFPTGAKAPRSTSSGTVAESADASDSDSESATDESATDESADEQTSDAPTAPEPVADVLAATFNAGEFSQLVNRRLDPARVVGFVRAYLASHATTAGDQKQAIAGLASVLKAHAAEHASKAAQPVGDATQAAPAVN